MMSGSLSDVAQVDNDWLRHRPPGKAESRLAPSVLIWGGLALLLALILLGGFYVVTKQAVERAHVHWAQATGVSNAGKGCDSAIRNAAGGCQTAGLELRRVSSGR